MKPVCNAMSIDVEDYFQVSALASAVDRTTWDSRDSRVEANTQRILDLLDRRGIKATFFVLGWIGERYPALVRHIAAGGHEVACHGYSHRLIFEQSESDFRAETLRSKQLLEDQIGTAVIGYRAASFSITAASLWALDVLIDAGFKYDSSVFPIRHDRYGIPGASRDMGRITAPSGRTLLEFPMSTASFAGLSIPVSGGGYFRIFPYFVTRLGLRSLNKQGRPFMFYLHPWEVDPEQPRIKVSALSRFRHYTNLHKCEGRLARLIEQFPFGPVRDVLSSRGLLPTDGNVRFA